MTATRWVHFLTASASAVSIASCGQPGCVSDLKAMETTLLEHAGVGATDCGNVPRGGDPSKVDACVTRAMNAGAAFVARYEIRGIDSLVTRSVARNAVGVVEMLSYDSAPCGGPGCAPKVDAWLCNGASVDPAPPRAFVALPPILCTSTTELGTLCR